MASNAFTPDNIELYESLIDKKFVRIDPTTKQPHASNKGSFWKIISSIPTTPAGGNNNDPEMDLVVQRFLRNKTYDSLVNAADNNSPKFKLNEAYTEFNSAGELVVGAGQVIITISNFLAQFKEDGK